MIIKNLPEKAQNIAADQGWDDETVGLEIFGLLRDAIPDWEDKLVERLEEIAREENSQSASPT